MDCFHKRALGLFMTKRGMPSFFVEGASAGRDDILSRSNQGPPPRPPRRRPKRYQGFTIFIFSCLLGYLLGYSLVFFNQPAVALENVDYGTIDVPTVLRGMIIREEQVVNSPRSGQSEYFYLEGDRVKKNALVCSVKDGDEASVIEGEIERLDESIIEAQQQRADLSLFKEDLTRISQSLNQLALSMVPRFVDGDLSSLASFADQVNTQMNLRNQIWLTENTTSTASLNEQKAAYQNQLSESVSNVYAQESGIFSLKVDQFEEIATPQTRTQIDRRQMEMNVQAEYISKSLAKEEGQPLFKIITSNIWYLAAYVPNDLASSWETGDTVLVTGTVGDEHPQVEMQVETMTPGESDTYVVFCSNQNMTSFLDVRTMDFYVEENIYTGFKIPNTAIVEKNFIKIPRAYLVESLDQNGVIKREGNEDRLIGINIAMSDEENVYILQDFGDLKIGDTLVSEGENATTYMLSEVVTYQGVYVANSSMAAFTVIEPLGSNNEYTIVRAGSQYGLKINDRIVSDAKTVEESEMVN